MRENNENIHQETEAAFALAVLLLNFLILAVVVGAIWSFLFLLSPDNMFSAALGETIWR